MYASLNFPAIPEIYILGSIFFPRLPFFTFFVLFCGGHPKQQKRTRTVSFIAL
jgi:hypothetical protein